MPPRVQRGAGPPGLILNSNCRAKCLPYLKQDFQNRCAYCLKHLGLDPENQTHVDHFDCSHKRRRRQSYSNFMLACSACNEFKLDTPLVNPFDPEQRLLNCTELNEFPDHITENAEGEWTPRTPSAVYHLETMHLADEYSRKNLRKKRRAVVQDLIDICNMAVRLSITNFAESQLLFSKISTMKNELRTAFPLVDDTGIQYFDDDFFRRHNIP